MISKRKFLFINLLFTLLVPINFIYGQGLDDSCTNCNEHGESLVEYYGDLPEHQSHSPQWLLQKDLDWLYELIMPTNYINSKYRKQGNKSFYPHTKDSLDNFPEPKDINRKNLRSILPDTIVGWITYVGFFPKQYKYDVTRTHEGIKIEVRVHLKNATKKDKVDFEYKMAEAEKLWQQNKVDFGFEYHFLFKIVEEHENPHYSVRLEDETRGPYDTKWSRRWNSRVIAHEMGHMLGLGDEYETLTSKSYCIRDSIMCNSWNGKLMDHHYYFVLRRLFPSFESESTFLVEVIFSLT